MNKIRKFHTGAVRDTEVGKEDMIEGISWLAMRRYAQYMDTKASKYGRGNWKKGIPPDQAMKSLLRHVQKFIEEWEYGICREKDDHLSAMVFNIFLIMHELELHKYGIERFPLSKEYKKIYKI